MRQWTELLLVEPHQQTSMEFEYNNLHLQNGSQNVVRKAATILSGPKWVKYRYYIMIS